MNVKGWKWSSTAAWLSLGVALLAFCMPAFSQLNLGRIIGSVTDESGGVMTGATVTVTDQDRGTSRVLKADQAGAFTAPSLIPGYAAHAASIAETLDTIYESPLRLATSLLLHFCGWIASAGVTWVAFHLTGHPID